MAFRMSARLPHRPNDRLAQKWCDLANRRRDHIVELYESGRWKHYYTEQELVAALRDATQALQTWAALADTQTNGAEPNGPKQRMQNGGSSEHGPVAGSFPHSPDPTNRLDEPLHPSPENVL